MIEATKFSRQLSKERHGTRKGHMETLQNQQCDVGLPVAERERVLEQ
jgi:hypothetical protein